MNNSFLTGSKIRLQHVATAVALNVVRVTEWVAGAPLAPTRRSALTHLQPAA